jgi:hypothetical protein
MQRLKNAEHAFRIVLAEIELRRLFETFMPLLVPKDGRSDKL